MAGGVFKSIQNVAHDDYKWIDARFSLQDEKEGKRKYAESHVKGAVHWDLNEDLSDMTKKNGRQPMPDKTALIDLFNRSGLELEDSILIYDDGGSPFAARAWWFLQYAGFKHAFIAIEGFDRIKKMGIPVDGNTPRPERTSVEPEWDESVYASRQFVERTVSGETDSILIDARAAERYLGETEPIDRIAGHIPGAVNFDWDRLKEDGAFRFDDAVRHELAAVANPSDEITVYCGSGVTASPLYVMLAHYGYENVRLYIGSYSDWVSHEGAEVEKG